MADAVDEKTRKTITMTHRQAAGTGLSVTAIFAILHFLSSNYASKSDMKALTDQVVDVKSIVKDGFRAQTEMLASHMTEEMHKHERIMDTLRGEIASEKEDRIRDDQGTSKRIDLVMQLFKIKASKTN